MFNATIARRPSLISTVHFCQLVRKLGFSPPPASLAVAQITPFNFSSRVRSSGKWAKGSFMELKGLTAADTFLGSSSKCGFVFYQPFSENQINEIHSIVDLI